MGLDQSAYAISTDKVIDRFSYREDGHSVQEGIFTWNGNPVLNRWMMNLFGRLKLSKPLSDMNLSERRELSDMFHGSYMLLTKSDIDDLNHDICTAKILQDWIAERREGGVMYNKKFIDDDETICESYSEDWEPSDIAFVRKARFWQKQMDCAIYYQCW